MVSSSRCPPASTKQGDCAEDRKSTRLNSSHVEISYAVFCLKKTNTGRALSTAPQPAVECTRGRKTDGTGKNGGHKGDGEPPALIAVYIFCDGCFFFYISGPEEISLLSPTPPPPR